MPPHDFEDDFEAARRLKEIIDKEEGMFQGGTALSKISDDVQQHYLGLPQRMLSGIYEKLEIMKKRGWTVDRQMEIYNQYVGQLKVTLKKFEETEDDSQAVNVIEQAVQNLRDFLYVLAYVDNLRLEVDSMCNNYMISMNKLSP